MSNRQVEHQKARNILSYSSASKQDIHHRDVKNCTAGKQSLVEKPNGDKVFPIFSFGDFCQVEECSIHFFWQKIPLKNPRSSKLHIKTGSKPTNFHNEAFSALLNSFVISSLLKAEQKLNNI